MSEAISPLPPQNLDAEESVLGACLLSESAIEAVSDAVQPGDFYRASHGRIFDAIVGLYTAGRPVDAITVADRLDAVGLLGEVGGKERVHELAALVPATSNARHYAEIVREMATLRGLIAVGEQTQRLGWERPKPTAELIDDAEQLVFGLARARVRSDLVAIGEGLDETWRRLEEIAATGRKVIGVPTGIEAVDRMTSGLQPGNLVVVAGRPSMGKALALDTRVLTPYGWTTMGTLRVGDEVIGGDGKPDVVTNIFDQGERDLYRVTFADGASVECCEEHLWLTQTRNERRRGAAGRPRPLAEIRESLYRHDSPRSANHTIPYVEPVHFIERAAPLPLDPYWLGLYLGDGDSSGGARVRLHTVDQELQRAFIALLPDGDTGTVRAREGRCPAVEIRRVKRNNRRSESSRRLDALGLLSIGSHGKFVPTMYLYGSVAERLAVLQGLCDSDGYVTDPSGAGIEYSTTSPVLCEDVKFLARSLGGRATSTPQQSNGAYRVNISFPSDGPMPVRLARKAEKWNGRRQRSRGRAIKRVDPSRRAECRCITVSRGLYVVDDFIVTHNTAYALAVASHIAIRLKRPVALFTLEMSNDEIRQRLLSSEGMVNSLRLRNGSLSPDEWRRLATVASVVKDAPLYVEDSRSVTLMEIRAKARRFAARHPDLALVIVDYLQLMSSGMRADNRVQEVSQISRSLKMLAGELAVPVMALSQLSRQVEQRHDKRPILSDLRESGGIEQDADVVAFLYRDAYYNPEDALEDGTEGVAECIIAKQRNGPTGTAKVAFVQEYASFGNLAPGQ